MTIDISQYTEDEIRAAHEEVWGSQAGEIVLADMERTLDVFGADYVIDDELAETPHPYRAYEERGMMRALRRIRGQIAALMNGRLAFGVADEEEESNADPET